MAVKDAAERNQPAGLMVRELHHEAGHVYRAHRPFQLYRKAAHSQERYYAGRKLSCLRLQLKRWRYPPAILGRDPIPGFKRLIDLTQSAFTLKRQFAAKQLQPGDGASPRGVVDRRKHEASDEFDMFLGFILVGMDEGRIV